MLENPTTVVPENLVFNDDFFAWQKRAPADAQILISAESRDSPQRVYLQKSPSCRTHQLSELHPHHLVSLSGCLVKLLL